MHACADDHEFYHNFINIISGKQKLWIQKSATSPPHHNPRNNVHKYEALEYDNLIQWHRKFYLKRYLKSYQNIILQTVTYLIEVPPLVNWRRNIGFQLN
jgi:hypothetical protein